jgi:hypothetical protein
MGQEQRNTGGGENIDVLAELDRTWEDSRGAGEPRQFDGDDVDRIVNMLRVAREDCGLDMSIGEFGQMYSDLENRLLPEQATDLGSEEAESREEKVHKAMLAIIETAVFRHRFF